MQSGNMFFFWLDLLSCLLLFVIICGIIAIISTYIADNIQTKQAIRYNYPVIDRLRYLFEKQDEFFRRYLFSQARKELSLNRAECSWAYRAAKNVVRPLTEDAIPPSAMTIAKGSPLPCRTNSIFNSSGMSYGAISKPAVMALSAKAWVAKTNCDIHRSVGLIAHACDVNEPGQLQRDHVRIVTGNGLSIALDKLFPLHE